MASKRISEVCVSAIRIGIGFPGDSQRHGAHMSEFLQQSETAFGFKCWRVQVSHPTVPVVNQDHRFKNDVPATV